MGPSWSYGSWIYNYLCNQCQSPRCEFEYHSGEVYSIQHYVISLSVTFGAFLRVLGFTTNTTGCHDKIEILLKVALSTITLTPLCSVHCLVPYFVICILSSCLYIIVTTKVYQKNKDIFSNNMVYNSMEFTVPK